MVGLYSHLILKGENGHEFDKKLMFSKLIGMHMGSELSVPSLVKLFSYKSPFLKMYKAPWINSSYLKKLTFL